MLQCSGAVLRCALQGCVVPTEISAPCHSAISLHTHCTSHVNRGLLSKRTLFFATSHASSAVAMASLLCCQQDRQNKGKIRQRVSSTSSVTACSFSACAETFPHHNNFQLYLLNCNSVWFGFMPSFSSCCKQHSPDCLTMHSNMFALLSVAAPLFFDSTFSCHRCYRSLGYPASSCAHEPKR